MNKNIDLYVNYYLQEQHLNVGLISVYQWPEDKKNFNFRNKYIQLIKIYEYMHLQLDYKKYSDNADNKFSK